MSLAILKRKSSGNNKIAATRRRRRKRVRTLRRPFTASPGQFLVEPIATRGYEDYRAVQRAQRQHCNLVHRNLAAP